MAARKIPVLGNGDRPIPTNKLWTWLLGGKASGSLWMYPWRVDPKDTGVELFFPIQWQSNGSDPLCDSPLRVSGVDFKATGVLMKDWGDWTFSFRLPESGNRYLDVTLGEGMPLAWIESEGVDLALKADPGATFLQADGTKASFPFDGDRLIIAASQRMYGVYVPRGTHFSLDGRAVRLGFPAGKRFAAFGALKDRADLARFAECALAIPRNSRVDWSYDAKLGKVKTTWTVDTEPLVAGNPNVVAQGWLAHQWRDATYTMKLDGPEYLTPRGPMKTSVGNRFELVYDFEGFLPCLPAPGRLGKADDFDPDRMKYLLNRIAKRPQYGDDTYWGGKDVLRFAQNMQMARQLSDSSYGDLRKEARNALADWLTYTPGENAHYFTRYDNWHALIGIKDSYDSARFNDQHFHYGYFTLSAALLAMEDPEFLTDYGEMIRLVAKQYANWDRKDMRFPLLRTFDVWAGHSWAGGLGSPGGNNQESTSEAMQSWIGLYLLGTMLDDPDMTATGAMGYAMESRATMEYWFNIHGDLLPRQYKHPTVGVLWSGGLVYGTYFSGDPGWIYGIQCLPQSPGLDYLVRDPTFARKTFRDMLALRKKSEGTDDIAKMGDLGNVLLAQAALTDPDWAVRQLDRLWDANSPIVRENLDAGTTYYNAHSYRKLGERQSQIHLSIPTSAVYYNRLTRTASYVVYNPKPTAAVVQATRGDQLLGTFTAPGRSLTCVSELERAN